MKQLNWEQALMDVQTAINWLKTEGECNKVGVMGISMGGALAIASICRFHGMGM
jgi:dienelactone hydrolase